MQSPMPSLPDHYTLGRSGVFNRAVHNVAQTIFWTKNMEFIHYMHEM